MEHTPLKKLFDTLPESVLITDENGMVVYTNLAMSDRAGYGVAEIVGKKTGTLWGGHMTADYYQHFWKKIADRQEPFIGQVANQYKHKSIQRETISVAPIIDKEKKTHFFIEIIPKEENRQVYNVFQKLFSNQLVYQEDILAWITHTTQKNRELLADTIRRELVAPTEQQFISRSEDKKLVEAAQIQTHVFSEIYLKYYADIKKYFSYHIEQTEEAEDLTQETFIRAFRYLPHFTISNASYLTYLKRIAHNLAINYYRDNKTTLPLEDVHQTDESNTLFLDNLFNKEIIERLLSSLTIFERELITQRYIQDLSIRDIATHLGKTENAVKLLLSRLKKKIKNNT